MMYPDHVRHVEAIREAIRAVMAQQAVVDAAQEARWNRDDPRSNHQKATALHNTQRKLRRLENAADDLVYCGDTRRALGREGQDAFWLACRTTFYTQDTLDVLDGLLAARA